MTNDTPDIVVADPPKPMAHDEASALATCLSRYAFAAWNGETGQLTLIPAPQTSDNAYRVPERDFRTHFWSNKRSDKNDILHEFHFNLGDVHCYAATDAFDDGCGHYAIKSIGFIVPERSHVH